MTAVQPPLWRDGWEVEPCTDAEHEQRPAIRGDDATSPSRRRRWADYARPSVTVRVTGGVL